MEKALLKWLRENGPIAVAFSGGVDSALLAKGAVLAAQNDSLSPPIACLAKSWTSSDDDLKTARSAAEEIGIPLIEVETQETANPYFLANGPDRCYYCKKIRFQALLDSLKAFPSPSSSPYRLINGENADDLSVRRPGRYAAEELEIRSPLAELGFSKEAIRHLARKWNLSVSDRPSTPCLVTRLAYGITPTSEQLRRIEKAESFLRREGFPILRVRSDAPNLARIEVPADRIPDLFESNLKKRILTEFKNFGFRQISVDLDGFASGKMDNSLSDANDVK